MIFLTAFSRYSIVASRDFYVAQGKPEAECREIPAQEMVEGFFWR